MTAEPDPKRQNMSDVSELDAVIVYFLASDAAKKPDNSPAFIEATKEWVARFGKHAVEQWRESKSKHRHSLVHLAAAKDLTDYLRFLGSEPLNFNVNVPRQSDGCTPLHVAVWYKKLQAANVLSYELNADVTVKNNYGEDCSADYQKLVDSYQNLIFLDLEMSASFYNWAARDPPDTSEANSPPRILEAAVIVTDKDLNELGRGEWVVGGMTKEYLEKLPDFHQRNFRDAAPAVAPPNEPEDTKEGETATATTATTVKDATAKQPPQLFPPLLGEDGAPLQGGNGLFSDMLDPKQAKPLAQVESELLKLLEKHCPRQACALAGCSVGCDRELLKLEMPRIYSFVSHRVVDVSSVLAGMMDAWCGPEVRNDLREFEKAESSDYNHRALNDCEAAIIKMKWVRKTFFAKPVLGSL
eukprot:TRINITY_DN11907_c0_g1_i1.p1 TRINITY_DN11907_c0_g1~~TRINITY_DN11907_c0_g1_i1.p1  ORF type:complete len:413 (+),score=61.21 TRINITY_DN11907_c0_g1_i1:55-1293(+)